MRATRLGLSVFLICLTSWSAAGSPEPGQLPEPGTIVERRLGGGEAHRYQLSQSPGEELWLTVDQDGVDVAVAIVDEDGLFRLTVDSPGGAWGEEWLLISSDTTLDRDAMVEIRGVMPHGAPGRYRLQVVSRFAAERVDPRLQAAREAVTEAGRLAHDGSDEARRRALELYRQALAGWRDLGRDHEAARTLFCLAILHRHLDEHRQSLTLLRQTLAEQRSLGELRGEAQSLMEIASTARMLGANEPVEEVYEEALERWRQLGDLQGQGRTLNYLGLIRLRTEPLRALEAYEEALTVFRQLGNAREEGVTLNNLGGLHHLQGEPRLALERFHQALEIHRRLDDLRQQATVWNNIASVHRRTGRLQEALEGYNASLEVRRQLDDRRGQGRVLNNLGLTWLSLGDASRARDVLRQALVLRRASEDRRGESITLHNLALAHADLGEWDAAVDFWAQALELRRALGDRGGEAETLVAMGEQAVRHGRPGAARRHLEKALPILDEIGNPWRQAKAWRALGEALTATGEPAQALTVLERSLRAFRDTGDDVGTGDALLALARAERAAVQDDADRLTTDRLDVAYAHATAALELLETVRADVDSLELRASFLSRHDEAFELAVDLAMELHDRHPSAGWAAKALEVAERGRARSLLDRLEASAGGPGSVDGVLLARQSELLERLNAKVDRRRRILGRQGPSPASARLAVETSEVLSELDAVESEIRRQNPAWDALTRPRPLTAAAIQAQLDSQTTLFEYALGEARSFLWVVTEHKIETFELPGRAVLEAAARDVYERWRVQDPRERRNDARAAARLSKLLLAPAVQLMDRRRLAIVADGALCYLPFAALPDPTAPVEHPLFVRYEVVSLPSVSILAAQRRVLKKRSPAKKALVVLADPVFGTSDPRLPRLDALTEPGVLASRDSSSPIARSPGLELDRLAWSRWEAEKIAAHAGEGQALVALGFDAELSAIRAGRLQGYRVVHFATHGLVEGEHPELSALVLSLYDAEGRAREGLLRLPEIYHLELDAELVVLSGCRTALGREIRGEGLVGLTRGFFAAGARRLVASLWRVQDRSAAELMDSFYRHLLGEEMRPAAALRAAQLELLGQPAFQDPYYWAAFALYGDWR